MKRITINYLKDNLLIEKQVRERANYHRNNGMLSKTANAKAASEIDRIQCVQVINVADSPESGTMFDIVHDVAKGRKNTFKVENIN